MTVWVCSALLCCAVLCSSLLLLLLLLLLCPFSTFPHYGTTADADRLHTCLIPFARSPRLPSRSPVLYMSPASSTSLLSALASPQFAGGTQETGDGKQELEPKDQPRLGLEEQTPLSNYPPPTHEVPQTKSRRLPPSVRRCTLHTAPPSTLSRALHTCKKREKAQARLLQTRPLPQAIARFWDISLHSR